MKIFSNQKAIQFRQKIAVVLAFILLAEAACPTITFALTSGPSAPEFSSFEPVTTTNMVNEFSGDFSYNIPVLNIPGPNGGGYAMSLSYHAGESAESEASWVGYGWTLNPGAINRNKRGYADDTKNTRTYYNDVPDNWTVSTGASIGNLEAFSFNLPLSVNASIRYNNYRGFGYTAGAGVSFRQGLVSLGYSISDGTGSFSAQVNPASLLTSDKKRKEIKDKADKYLAAKTSDDKDAALAAYRKASTKTKKESRQAKALSTLGAVTSSYGMFALGDKQMPTSATTYNGESFNVNFNLQTNPSPVEVGPQFGFTGNFNHQRNEGVEQRKAYGYLYSAAAYGDAGGMMDYSVEKESMYNKRDRFLSIPFSNADAFSISGEGLGGGFRLHSRAPGHFRPNAIESKTFIGQISADVCLGLEFGAGFNVGTGQQSVRVNGDDWGSAGSGNTPSYRFLDKDDEAIRDRNEAFFFRFNGDQGGDVDFGDDNAVSAALVQDSWVPGAKTFHPQVNNVNTELGSMVEDTKRSGRSSYIGYHTNAEMSEKAYTYEKSLTVIADGTTVNRSNNPEQIGEISTVNEDGNRYVYGLPVAVKNETSLQFDVEGGTPVNNFIVTKDISNPKRKVGEVDNGTYYNSYLLTQITTPDYVDRLRDGPSTDDFGGYTKFEYDRPYSVDAGTGFHYRMPFNGLQYNKGDMTDPTDDMGSYTSGDKDVCYLKRVVTKTHVALFYTSPRTDGKEAANDKLAATNLTATGTKTLQKLDSILLRTNDAANKLIKKVVFKYNNTLCTGAPNAASGKLTLAAIYFESDGIVNVKVSPYQFTYLYPNIASTYPAEYASFATGYSFTTTQQNPPYSQYAVDAWGNYQRTDVGVDRYGKMQNNLYQGPYIAAAPYNTPYDPAAWQLKTIKLPSGGEIHVQYEQDDYLYVQDRRAMALVSLSPTPDPLAETSSSDTYSLNVADIDVATPTEKDDLVTLINQNLKNQKIYFKFLYALLGNLQSSPLNACNSDYVTGYVNFIRAYVEGGVVKIQVGDGSGNSGHSLPRKVCLDLVKKQKGGKLNENGNCNVGSGVQSGLDGKTMVNQLIGKIRTSFFTELSSCKQIKPSLSYFKIPVLKAKRGGGLRVKRLLMYDANGIDYGPTGSPDGIAALYGTEYIYQTEDGKSSGVATNEPSTIREENALVTCLAKRSEQGFFSKAISGTDREQFEGPIGESLLPSPSVGYSRVVIRNIHSGKTNSGFVVNEFNTVKDYPFDMKYDIMNANAIDQTPVKQEQDPMTLPAIITNISIANIWASQGYRFIINSMNGQPKSVSTYSGSYSGGAISTYAKSSSTAYEYFQPGEKVYVSNQANGALDYKVPGKETEIVFEIKQVEDITEDASIEIDFGVGVAGIIPLPQASASPLVNYTENKMRTHVTSKVIQYPVIQKAVVVTQNGISHRTDNQIFSAQTGKPVKTVTTDGYDGLMLGSASTAQNGVYANFITPAYSQYKSMTQKAISERYILKPGSDKLANISMSYTLPGSGSHYLSLTASPGYTVCQGLGLFTIGDLIRINGSSAYYYISRFEGNRIYLMESSYYLPGLSSTAVSTLEIVKTARTNQLNAIAGEYTTYGIVPAPVNIPADPSRKASWDQFILTLNNALGKATPQTIDMAPYALYVGATDGNGNCTAINGSITVNPKTGGVIDITSTLNTDILKNGDFSSCNPNCPGTPGKEFEKGCVYEWSYTHGVPSLQTGTGNPYARIGVWGGGIYQNARLSPYKQYQLSLKTNGRAGIYAGMANSANSGIPNVGIGDAAWNPNGIQVLNTFVPTTGLPHDEIITSNPFYGNEACDQFYIIMGADISSVNIDDITLKEIGCTSSLYNNAASGNGTFGYNEAGQILYYSPDNNCYPQVVPCFKFCTPNPSYQYITNVISASATTYSAYWGDDNNRGRGNPYESGEYGKWRTERSYEYNASTVSGSKDGSTERNYKDAGTFTMRFFRWEDPILNRPQDWINTNTVTKYTPNGDIAEEKDALGVYSAAKFGYNSAVPYIIAKNNSYECLKFEGFENIYQYSNNYYTEEYTNANLSQYVNVPAAPIAHSGFGSYRLSSTENFAFRPFRVDAKTAGRQLSLKVWIKDATRSSNPVTCSMIKANPSGSMSLLGTKLGQSGDWALYEFRISNLQNGAYYNFDLKSGTGSDVYIDDMKQQLIEASGSAFVYNPNTLRTVATFNDSHFGLFYRYNAEGKLVSKISETEKGMKTLTEQQQNHPLVTKP